MPASIGVNLRVTGHCRQGGRKYMEDFFSVAYQQTEDERDLEYAFFGIFDGHGGAEAAAFAKEHLMESIVKLKSFWSDNDEDVLRAIKDGYLNTHYAMWREQEKWPKTAYGLPSTAGTTASIAFIRRGKIYIGHVGDSGIILGYQEPGCPDWKARPLTKDHKPENAVEISRIEQCGGKVISKSGVPRVVWNRPRIGRQGPVLRSTQIDEIPFLAVARSLGDLWSYNSQLDEFIVSPDPDCSVIPIDTGTFRCLIFGTDGLYNMLSPQMAVHIVQQAERHNENAALSDSVNKIWLNPSKCLVEKALERWRSTKMRADNTSVVTLILDPPGPPRAQVLKIKKKKHQYPNSGLKIFTRYEYKDDDNISSGFPSPNVTSSETNTETTTIESTEYEQSTKETPLPSTSQSNLPTTNIGDDETNEKLGNIANSDANTKIVEADSSSWDVPQKMDENIQINEISSSSDSSFNEEANCTEISNTDGDKKSTKSEPEVNCRRLRHSLNTRSPVKTPKQTKVTQKDQNKTDDNKKENLEKRVTRSKAKLKSISKAKEIKKAITKKKASLILQSNVSTRLSKRIAAKKK